MTTQQPNDGPSAWVVRAGKFGEDEDTALEQGIAIIGFQDYADATGKTTQDEIRRIVSDAETGASQHQINNFLSQFFAFVVRIQIGDVVVLPLKTRRGQFAVGRCVGDYEYRQVDGDFRHTRQVQWRLATRSRDDVDPTFRPSLNAVKTVFRIRPPGAYDHFAALLADTTDHATSITPPILADGGDLGSDDTDDQIDIAELAREAIHKHIHSRFTAHELERLVAAILEAEGYIAQQSRKGADQGVDVLAGHGPMGFDSPKLCVQVKHTSSPTGAPDVQKLRGAMQDFSAEQGLFVSWSDYTSEAKNEARRHFFTLRLWNANDVIDAVCRNYDRLPEEIRAEIPLQQIWTVIPED